MKVTRSDLRVRIMTILYQINIYEKDKIFLLSVGTGTNRTGLSGWRWDDCDPEAGRDYLRYGNG